MVGVGGWGAGRCFQRVFVWVNLFGQKLKHVRDDGHTVSVDLDLQCLDYMWKIALLTPSEEIASLAIGFLRDLHTCLAENLEVGGGDCPSFCIFILLFVL